jgi:hypothetical protein
MRLSLIGGGGEAAALALWVAAPGWLLGVPRFAWSPSPVFYSILFNTYAYLSLYKSDMWTSFGFLSDNPLQK